MAVTNASALDRRQAEHSFGPRGWGICPPRPLIVDDLVNERRRLSVDGPSLEASHWRMP